MRIEPISDERAYETDGFGEAVPLPLEPGQAVTVKVQDLVTYTREVQREGGIEDVTFVSLIATDPEQPAERYMISAGADSVFGQGLLRVFSDANGLFHGAGFPRTARLKPEWQGKLVKVGKVKKTSLSSPHSYHVLVYQAVEGNLQAQGQGPGQVQSAA